MYVVIIVVSLMLVIVCNCQQQDLVQFLPINNWNCGNEETAQQICGVPDGAIEWIETSSLTECAMHCWMKLSGDCLQFNYYTVTTLTSTYCLLCKSPPKKYIIVASGSSYTCQHYVVKIINSSSTHGNIPHKQLLRCNRLRRCSIVMNNIEMVAKFVVPRTSLSVDVSAWTDGVEVSSAVLLAINIILNGVKHAKTQKMQVCNPKP